MSVPAMLISVFFHSPVQIKIFSASLILRLSCECSASLCSFGMQTDEFEFEELVRTSTLLCFSSSKTTDSDQTLKGRKRIPLTDPEVNVTYHLISSAKSTILQSVSPTFEFRYQK